MEKQVDWSVLVQQLEQRVDQLRNEPNALATRVIQIAHLTAVLVPEQSIDEALK
jgi:hypothetical protein